jgi:hypothetical protein
MGDWRRLQDAVETDGTAEGSVGGIGDSCIDNTNCFFGYCDLEIGFCGTPSKACPSTDLALGDCSGNGDCIAKDMSSSPVDFCAIYDPKCTVSCSCFEGFAGKDCSLLESQKAGRESARLKMCGALINATTLSDPSGKLLESMTASLLQTFDPSEVTNPESIELCLEALTLLSDMLTIPGMLTGTSASLPSTVASAISSFNDAVIPLNLTTIDTGMPTSYPTQAPTSAPTLLVELHHTTKAVVYDMVGNLQKAMMDNMLGGENSPPVLSSAVRMKVQRGMTSDLNGATLKPPDTDEEATYGSDQPQMILPESGMSVCQPTNGDGYSKASMMKWGKNPYENPEDSKSPILRVGSGGNKYTIHEKRREPDYVAEPYYIIQKFNSEMNLTDPESLSGESAANIT